MKLNKTYWFLIFILLSSLLLSGCRPEALNSTPAPSISTEAPASTDDASLTVHFISVGQGNAVLAESEGHFMLIDGGDGSHSSKVISYLKEQRIQALDYVIATHYDADHLSGILGSLEVFSVGTLLDPDYEADSKLFASYQKRKSSLGITSVHPAPGDTYTLGSCQFTILAPGSSYYSDENDYSIALRLVCGSTSFLLAGDAGTDSEEEMLSSGLTLKSDVYLASHHGSRTASSAAFLDAVAPSYAVISVGRDNSYGHPHEEVLERLSARNAALFRTDTQGTILAKSDGENLTFNVLPDTQYEEHKASTENTSLPFIGNKNTKKFHRSDCSGLPKESNRIYFESSQEAVSAGYSPCKNCSP